MGADASKGVTAETPHPSQEEGLEADDSRSNSGKRPMMTTRSQSVPNPIGTGDDCDSEYSVLGMYKHPLKRRSTMVIVNQAQDNPKGVTDDPLMKKLEELHFFYPLMHDVEKRSGLFGTHNRKALADIQSKIQPLPALKLVRIYESRLKTHAETVSLKQATISCSVMETDIMIASLLKLYQERAKITAKNVDRLTKLDDLKRNMNKCQESFNECLAIISLLNDMLPETERLEPFTFTDDEALECVENN
ncbi:Loss of heterozygosity 12 chromosomal region 1 protein [Orchesella cincta]|uniref:BLOC-1-related complex subunit 5 n=1 Tax=Orchesella cincta TaxID=48709 RepID=A0A1D2MG27_ORCCI|nr:Loss of heterozygosity 12 chromosomal region 1 protein [Orchesella cincta]